MQCGFVYSNPIPVSQEKSIKSQGEGRKRANHELGYIICTLNMHTSKYPGFAFSMHLPNSVFFNIGRYLYM